jgi:hypothetical protein
MEENKFKCDICKKYYKSYQSLWNHKKKFHQQIPTIHPQNDKNTPTIHPQNTHIIKIKKTDQTNCDYCNKILSCYNSMNRHLKTCKKKHDIIKENEELKLKTQQQEQRILNIEQKLENITNKMELTTTNNNTINNTNNGTINNNINIFQFGSETVLEKLPAKEAIELLKKGGFKALIEAIIMTHFSKDNPEGHNIFMNNITDKYLSVYDKKKGKVIFEPVESAVDFTLGQRRYELEELLEQYKDELNEIEVDNLENVIDIQNDCPKHVIDKTKKLAVKNKEMVKQTLENVVNK